MKTQLTAILAAAVLASTVQAQPTVTTSVSVASKDVMSRGFVLSQDPFMQPQVMISNEHGYVYMNNKFNLAQGGADRGAYIGVGTNVAIPRGNVNVEVGQLALPSGARIPELYTCTSFDVPFKPTFEAVISGGKSGKNAGFAGNYFSAGASQSKTFGKATVTLAGKVGYNDNYGTNYSGFSHANIDATVAVPVSKNLTLSTCLRQLYSLHAGVPTDHSVSAKATYKF